MASRRRERGKALTSIRIFRQFIQRTTLPDGRELLDASGVVSRECYELWLSSRKSRPPRPEKAFQRSLSAHIGRVDGRVPFTAEEEKAILHVIRKKDKWPCFAHSKTRYGLMGFRAKGYHERLAEEGQVELAGAWDEEYGNEDEEDYTENHASPPIATSEKKRAPVEIEKAPKRPRPSPMTMVEKASDTNNGLMLIASNNPKVSTFAQMAMQLLSRCYHSALESWQMVLSMLRYAIISNGRFFECDMDQAREIFDQTCEGNPGQGVIVVNPLSKSPTDRYLLINDIAFEWLGPICKYSGGIHREMFPPEERWNAFKVSQAVVTMMV